ncbi:MAG: hypothetical protein JNL23_12435 [Chitinophagaceae bacterium]|nr:hypothetical protein [Chitinophagaceae bacterium]
MDKITLYPELVNYIFGYCSEFKTDNESKAEWHHFALEKSGNEKKEKFYTHFKERGLISFEPAVLDLLKDGFQTFKENVASRIYQEHKNDLKLNLCPKCFKIARTSLAKQCQFCFHSWHTKDD